VKRIKRTGYVAGLGLNRSLIGRKILIHLADPPPAEFICCFVLSPRSYYSPCHGSTQAKRGPSARWKPARQAGILLGMQSIDHRACAERQIRAHIQGVVFCITRQDLRFRMQPPKLHSRQLRLLLADTLLLHLIGPSTSF
jgi:hypothetical protein